MNFQTIHTVLDAVAAMIAASEARTFELPHLVTTVMGHDGYDDENDEMTDDCRRYYKLLRAVGEALGINFMAEHTELRRDVALLIVEHARARVQPALAA